MPRNNYGDLAADALTARVTGGAGRMRAAILLEVPRRNAYVLGGFLEDGGFNVRRIPGGAPASGTDVLVVHAGRVPLEMSGLDQPGPRWEEA